MSHNISKKIKKNIVKTNQLLLQKEIALNSGFAKCIDLKITSSKEKCFARSVGEYCRTYSKILEQKEFLLILKDLGIIQATYETSRDNKTITSCSLIYYPNPGVQKGESSLFEKEFSEEQLLQFSRNFDSKYIRIDANPKFHKEILHPSTHLHIGIFSTGRIVLRHIPSYSEFVDFILFLYYPNEWKKFNDICDKGDINNFYKKRCLPKLAKSLLTNKEEMHYTLNL